MDMDILVAGISGKVYHFSEWGFSVVDRADQSWFGDASRLSMDFYKVAGVSPIYGSDAFFVNVVGLDVVGNPYSQHVRSIRKVIPDQGGISMDEWGTCYRDGSIIVSGDDWSITYRIRAEYFNDTGYDDEDVAELHSEYCAKYLESDVKIERVKLRSPWLIERLQRMIKDRDRDMLSMLEEYNITRFQEERRIAEDFNKYGIDAVAQENRIDTSSSHVSRRWRVLDFRVVPPADKG